MRLPLVMMVCIVELSRLREPSEANANHYGSTVATELQRAARAWTQAVSMRQRRIVTIEANLGSETVRRDYAERWLTSKSDPRSSTVGSYISLNPHQDYLLVRHALERLGRIARREVYSNAGSEDALPEAFAEAPRMPSAEVLSDRARSLSAAFLNVADVHRGIVRFTSVSESHIVTIGSGVATKDTTSFHSLEIECHSVADDGGDVSRSRRWAVKRYEDLPEDDQIAAVLKDVIAEVQETKRAPALNGYSGPVLFEDVAAPQLFAFMLGNYVSREVPGAPAEVGPAFLRVIDEPLRTESQFVGSREFEEFGTRARSVVMIDKGRLIETTDVQHLRSMPGALHPLPSNVMVQAVASLSTPALYREASSRARAVGNDYVLVVSRMGQTRIVAPDSSAMSPTVEVAFKVYVNGRRERVRVGTLRPILFRDLKNLVAVGEGLATHGELWVRAGVRIRDRMIVRGIPLSVTSPALLVDDVNLQGPATDPVRSELLRYLATE